MCRKKYRSGETLLVTVSVAAMGGIDLSVNEDVVAQRWPAGVPPGRRVRGRRRPSARA